MNNDFVIWGLLLLALVAANAPFLSNRLYLIKQLEEGLKKSPWIRLLELVSLYFIIGLLSMALENKINGQIHAQDWEFYAVTFFMFLVFALPGFIYRYTFHK
ncbi:MAG: DUF2818 family protein [Gammaproteobacteria bacterium]|nr:DUF2818 family protein [Gammaproteobacteria bacterium]